MSLLLRPSAHLAASVAVAALCDASAAQAQGAVARQQANAEPLDADEAEGEEIVVTGSIVEAQQSSIQAKRRAPNVVDVAAADAVGRFPDQNSAAALARLPAVAVQRDQGQERYIQVRGAPNRWTSVSIDGIPMIGVDEGGDSRAFRFDAIPAVLLSRMVVNKSLNADNQADAIVATIDLQTYSPLDGDGFNLSGDAGYGFMEHGGGEQRQGSLRASWANDVFGIVLGGSHYRRKQLTDNREVGAYDEPSSAADPTFGPTEFDIRLYKIERWSNGLFGGVELAPARGLRLHAKGIFTEFNDDEQRNQYELRLARAAGGFRNLESGDLVGVPLAGSFNYGEYRNRNTIGTIGGDFDDDSGFEAGLKLNYTRTVNTSYLPLVQSSTSGLNSPSLTYDASDPRFPIVTLYRTIAGPMPNSVARGPALTDFDQGILSVPGTIMIGAVQRTESDSYTARLDLTKQFDTGLELGAGGMYIDRAIEGNNFSFSNVVALGALGPRVGQPFDVNSYVTDERWDTQFPLGFTLNYVDNVAMRRDVDRLLDTAQQQGLFDPAANVPASDRYDQDEKLLAGYVMARHAFGPATIIGGVRLEHYELDNAGTARAGAILTPLSVRTSKTDLFPSLNLKFDATDRLVFRLAGQRGISRPAYGAIRVGGSINDTASPGTISGGNPLLKPEYTWGLDGSVEYYLPGNGIISLAGFHRWVDNVLYQGRERVGSDLYDSNGRDRSDYLLTATYNGTNGRLYGAEFNFQNQFKFLPAPLDGFGFHGNLTLLDGQFDTDPASGSRIRDIAFPGMSDTILNASLFYEKHGLSARASYQWRSDWLDTLGGLGSGEYRQGYENLDVSIRYALTEQLTLFADLANLTDETYVAYMGSRDMPSEVEQIGRRYLFGVRFEL